MEKKQQNNKTNEDNQETEAITLMDWKAGDYSDFLNHVCQSRW
jgi:hypothetical protein